MPVSSARCPLFFQVPVSPLIPPTKSIRVSVRGSCIPSSGESIFSCRILTSRMPIGSLGNFFLCFQLIPVAFQVHPEVMQAVRVNKALFIFSTLKFSESFSSKTDLHPVRSDLLPRGYNPGCAVHLQETGWLKNKRLLVLHPCPTHFSLLLPTRPGDARRRYR